MRIIDKIKTYLGLPLFVGVFILTLFVSYRSHILEITNDEAFSFWMVSEHKLNMLCGTANNHWLNTFFMFLWTHLMGNSAWMIRIHSVLSFSIFSFFTLSIFKKYNHKVFLLLPFSLLLCNFYFLDYFSLARGYAISLMFEAMALYFIISTGDKQYLKIYSLLALSVLSNYSSIYFLASYFIIDSITFFKHTTITTKHIITFLKKRYPALLIVIWAIPNILFIKYYTGDLEEGQRNGFIPDTLGVFLQRSMGISCSNETIIVFLIAILLGIFIFYFMYRKVLSDEIKMVLRLIIVAFLMIEILYHSLHIPFPYGRTSFFINYLFFIVLLLIFIHLIHSLNSVLRVSIVICISGLFIYNSLLHFRLNTTVEFWPQQSFKKAYSNIIHHKDYTTHAKIGMSIDHYGVYANYYHYLYPAIYTNPVYVYNSREGYREMNARVIDSLFKQDYLLLIKPYDDLLKTMNQQLSFEIVTCFPEMQTDLMYLKPIH